MPDLKPSAQDIAAEITADSISSLPCIMVTYANNTDGCYTPSYDGFFGAPTHTAVLINSFWLLSLLISLTCALMAISLQQWARRYAKVASPRYSLPEQARAHAFFVVGIERLNFVYVAEALPVLVHISLALFFAGFLLYVKDLDSTVYALACSWIGLFIVVYAYVTCMPIFRPDSPFYTPLSHAAACVYAGTSYGVAHIISSGPPIIRVSMATREHFRYLKGHYRNLFLLGTTKLAEAKAREQSSEIDGDVLKRTLDALRADDDLEQFFEAILGFCDSELVEDPQHSIDILGRKRLAETVEGFWNRTLSSSLVSEAERRRRIVTCLKVINAACLSSQDLCGVLRSVEIGYSLKTFVDGNLAPLARCIISGIISNAGRDDRWLALAMDELCVSEDVLRSYLAHGDSVLLAVLIHFIRQVLHPLIRRDSDLTEESLRILPSVSNLDILNTLPELQHEFCALWNESVRDAQKGGVHNNHFSQILVDIRHLYLALHPIDFTSQDSIAFTPGFDDVQRQSASYPMCKAAHHLNFDIHDAVRVGGTTSAASRLTTSTPTSLTVTLPDSDVVLATVTPHVSSLPSPNPGHSSGDSSTSDVPNVPQPATRGASSCYSIPTQSQNLPTASPRASACSHYSSMTNPIPLSSSSSGNSQRPNQDEIVGPTVLETPVTGSNNTLYRRESSSPVRVPINALSRPNPQAATISGAYVTTSMATVGAHNDVQHLDLTIRIELRRRPGRSDPSSPDIVTNAPWPRNRDSSENPA